MVPVHDPHILIVDDHASDVRLDERSEALVTPRPPQARVLYDRLEFGLGLVQRSLGVNQRAGRISSALPMRLARQR
jgi:hypothetical protein